MLKPLSSGALSPVIVAGLFNQYGRCDGAAQGDSLSRRLRTVGAVVRCGTQSALLEVEEPAVVQILERLRFAVVLDAASGTGRHAMRLAREGARAVALDESPQMLTLSRANAVRSRIQLDHCLALIDQPLPFIPAQFDLVIRALALSHVGNIDAPIGEFHRTLRRVGHLLVTDIHPEAVARGLRTAFHIGGTKYLLSNRHRDPNHYFAALERAGFHLVHRIEIPIDEAFANLNHIGIARVGDPEWRRVPLCLIALAQKDEHSAST